MNPLPIRERTGRYCRPVSSYESGYCPHCYEQFPCNCSGISFDLPVQKIALERSFESLTLLANHKRPQFSLPSISLEASHLQAKAQRAQSFELRKVPSLDKKKTFNTVMDQIRKIPKIHFRKMTGPSLKGMAGNIKEIALDRDGSQYLAFRLFKEPDEEVNLAFSEIEKDLMTLVTHESGNLVVRSLIKVLHADKQTRLLNNMNVKAVIADRYGNGVIQHAMYGTSRALKKQIIDLLAGSIIHLAKKPYSSFALEKIIDNGPPHLLEFFVDELGQAPVEMAKDIPGNRVLQKIIICFPEHKISGILQQIYNNIEELLFDPVGSFVLHTVMAKNRKNKSKVILAVTKVIERLALTEQGKRTINKAIMAAHPNEIWSMIHQVITTGSISRLYANKWGKEIILQMINHACEEQREILMQRLHLRPILGQKKRVTKGRNN